MKKIKISKEQYNRLTSIISESFTKLSPDNPKKVDRTFKQAFSNSNIKNLGENDFNISEPIDGMSSNIQGKFMKEGEGDLKHETLELIKYLYRKSEELSPFWAEHNVSYDDICDTLESKGMIIKKDGKFEISKKLGDAEQAKQAIEQELSQLIGGNVEKTEIDEVENNTDKFHTILFNREIAILKDNEGNLYAYYYYEDKNNIEDLIDAPIIGGERNREYAGRDSEGNAEYDDDIDYEYGDKEISKEDIDYYVNNNLDSFSFGEGKEGWNDGDSIVKIDDELKQELIDIYSRNPEFVKLLSNIAENSYEDIKNKLGEPFKQQPKPEKSEEEKAAAMARLKALRQAELERRKKESGDIEETTGAASAGAFTPAFNAKPLSREINETTQGADSMGQYDANALPIGRNGEFKKVGKTKAETTPQWAGGEFVEQPDCSKPNNNTEAQNGGCNAGASSLKTRKAKGSVNAPSLAENKIYETIANQTGKTIDEVKRIIESNLNK